MQNLKLRSIDDFLEFLPEDQRLIVDRLREIVLECLPFCTEKLSYNVPYYYGQSRICFIWPSAVPWGKVKKDGVLIGFCKGHLLEDEIDFLEKGERKQVYTKTYTDMEEIDEDLLKAYIFAAAELDEA